MAGRRQHAAFRPAATTGRTSAPSRRQAVVLILALVLVAAAIAVASFAVKPSKARSFDLFHGSVLINDDRAPVSVDLATGKPSIKLGGAYTQVSGKQSGDLDVVPLADGSLLLNPVTGEFNMTYSSNYVIKPTGGGVPLATTSESTTSTGIASGDSAYIVRTGTSGTSVYLVSKSTVSASVGGAQAKPRASVGMDQPTKDVQTTAASANTDLWMLAGTGTTRTIRQLSLPPGTNPGASLDTKDHGTVNGAAAVGTSTVNDDGSGGDVIAVASSSSIRVFDASGAEYTVPVKAPSGVDSILPTTNQQGAFSFLYHSSAGWSAVRAAVTGTGEALVQSLGDIGGSSALAVPAQSSGLLYTMDRSSGALYQISGSGAVSRVPGTKSYPIVDGETSDFALAGVLARGSRVIFNSRANLEALTVFSDGSHAPVVVDKRDAVTLAPNGAAALADQHQKPGPANTAKAPPKSRVDPAQQVTDKIRCRTTTQIPHIPTVQLVDRGARSAQLQWTYPLLDPQDCAPSTYTVSVQLAGDNAPSPPTLPPIQGQTGVNVTGLFPDTEYKMVVTAYLNGKGTPSAPLPVRTSVEGPAAPTNVQTSTDDKGNWTVTWNSCGGVQNNCVPTANWTVVPQLCDGAGGLQNAPADAHQIGDPTSHTFRLIYKGSDDLLGRGLRFQVEGVGTKGTTGTASKSSNCAYSWAHPVAADIHIAASTPPAVSGQDTSHTSVTVSFTGDPNVALGGAGGQLTYQLLSGDSTVTTKGPTSDTSVSLDGILPGQSYSVRVLVSPPRHSTASVSLPTVDVKAAVANWPALTTTASFDPGGASDGKLTVNIGGLSSHDARGETFDLADGSQLICGNAALTLSKTDFDPSQPLTFPVDRSQDNGSCSVTVKLVEDANTVRDPAYFGGNPSSASAAGAVSIPVPTLDTSAGQFSANFVSGGILSAPKVAVSYHGGNSLLGNYGDGWQTQVQYQDSGGTWTNCGDSSSANLGQAAATIDIGSCYYGHRSASFQVLITFTYFGQSPPDPGYAVTVDGNGPEPVDPGQMSFAGYWSSDDSSILVGESGYGQGTVNQLNWTLDVTSNGSTCGSITSPPAATSSPQFNGTPIPVDPSICPPVITTPGSGSTPPSSTPATYTVSITFKDPTYGTTKTYTIANGDIGGTPPQ